MRGPKVPSFYRIMFELKIKKLMSDFLNERPDIFIIDYSIVNDNEIDIIIDGDNDITVNDCISFSRYLESHIDRNLNDFSLNVKSFGATKPFILSRQYYKHKGRTLSVKTSEQKYLGKLIDVNDKNIVLSWKERQPKPVGKGKITVTKEIDINFNNIKEAKVKIKY